MLRFLSIRDFAIVDRMELEFGPGFTVLTGETGAGKSILIDALSYALGERGDAMAVRPGCERAEVNAEFDAGGAPGVAEWLRENDLEDDPGVCLLRRTLDASGRSRAFVNGHPATVQQLREAGERLVDIHGQHAHQSLIRADAQRELLDAYAECRALSREVAAACRHWQDLKAVRLAREKNAAAVEAEREELEWRVRELKTLGFSEDEWQELQAEHGRLAHAASLIEGAQFGLEILSEAEGSSLAQLEAALGRLQALKEFDPALKEILELLEPAQIQLKEAAYALRHYQERLDLDPERLRQAEARLQAVHGTARKFRVTPNELPALLASSAARLETLRQSADLEAMQEQEEQAGRAYRKLAETQRGVRQKAARSLSLEVSAAMQGLAMAGGAFSVALAPFPEGGSHGLDQVEFQVSAHAGLPLRPLAKVASGGELSRISLAIQVITSRVAAVPTLIFDEVDAGIGGKVAEIVGRMMRQLGRERQVMCVTHLPQVAASGDHQWRVTKSAVNGSVVSRVAVLDGKERVEEIARMLGGVKITETTRRHAAEMLGMK